MDQLTTQRWITPAIAALVSGACTALLPAQAQDYPVKPVKLVVTLPAGSTVDALARVFSQQADTRLNQRFIVENQPGAGLVLGMQTVVTAPADGYTLAFTPATPLTVQLQRSKKLPYNSDSFTPVCQTFENIFVLAVAQSSPIKDFKSFIALARTSPGKLRYAHSGAGSSPHLMAAELWHAAGVTLTDVPYRGETAFISDLIAGEVEGGMLTAAAVQAQKLRPLAVFSGQRLKWFPDVPTVNEVGYRIPPAGYGGLFVRSSVPPSTLAKLEQTCRDIVNSAAYQTSADGMLQNATYLDRKDFSARIAEDAKSNAKLLAVLNLPE